uniref:Uncharacterized protein n=2 Tax=Pan TaxID=9596 RepID=A0A2I3RHQ9_PANTR
MVCFGTYLLLYETVCCIAGLLFLPPQLQILFCLKTTVCLHLTISVSPTTYVR